MSRRRRRPLVPESREALDTLKARVMANQGYKVGPDAPEEVKYEVAREKDVPLQHGYNGRLTSREAGKVGGPIGGSMVKELIRLAQESLNKKQ
ncbi:MULTISPECIES: alpha/beta-type small acid-soluble spore protein [Bacillus]|uniref:Small acid soluble protein n=1 Tax=Bacillus infantis NRRL B-14911 TaxID=1367477 RepID=U5LHT5_9BACI|nr:MULTISPECIES: alpha/beta-type small acid-soluble spore protein [Bacillus]AGX06206.1 small acid soluble protein [Bacillus infantis NRRL B-14911]MCA1033759.1 alpha/beta-type small acid-soluble spore protein [Bacillus infantis]MCP1160457.1 alpha/beta-type small acid-soluble spore protein [Bacillus infantis]PLR73754.1 small acid-soluble spore protein [Bacillus sp. UMB0728]RYI27984.1 alpha/beta-type small acid-soluble spore protein [Bacillus infantis]